MLPKTFLAATIFCTLLLTGCTVPLVGQQTNTPAALTAMSQPPAEVYIDNEDIGQTPINKKSVLAGQHQITLKTSQASWSKFITFYSGTDTYVSRQFAANDANSTGSVMTLEKGSGLDVVGSPQNAQVLLDSKNVGQTPLYMPDIPSGQHNLTITLSGFAKSDQQINIVNGYKIVANIDLAQTGAMPQEEATPSAQTATPPPPSGQTAIVNSPTGWVRIRASATTGSAQLAQANNGDILTILSKSPGWYQVKTAAGVTGWAYAQYLTIQ